MFGRKNEKKIAQALEHQEIDQGYWAIVKRQFRKNRAAVWSLRLLYVIFFIALFGDFIANEKPVYCKINGTTYFPILRDYKVSLGLDNWEAKFIENNWSEHEYESVVMPLIPYSHTTQDPYNTQFVSPFDDQRVKSLRYWHWMGTDQLGHDIAAGMIRGTRIAVLVGIVAMGIATIIGIFLGALAGYYGDNRFKISRIRLWLSLIGLFFAYFYAFNVRGYSISIASENEVLGIELIKSFAIFFGIMAVFNLLATFLKRIPTLGKQVTIAMDIIVMRLIEIMNSIPALLLILAGVAILEKASIIHVMVIIGLIRWTGIARFIRAELLRVRSLEYVEAAQAMGFSETRTILRHAIPNALTPVLITIAFGVASAILIEAFLSFLGVGDDDQVTWGSLLSLARSNFSAWWLAIFPGFAIFITVTIFNLIGEGLTDALDPKLRQ